MISFEVSVNGERLCRAGVGEYGVLSAIATWGRRQGPPPPGAEDWTDKEWTDETLELDVGGFHRKGPEAMASTFDGSGGSSQRTMSSQFTSWTTTLGTNHRLAHATSQWTRRNASDNTTCVLNESSGRPLSRLSTRHDCFLGRWRAPSSPLAPQP